MPNLLASPLQLVPGVPLVGRSARALAWSLRLGSVAGIGVYLHTTFLLLLAFLVVRGAAEGRGLATVLGSVLFTLAIFATVVLHELGHALAARRLGIATRDITLFPIGGVARLERFPDAPWHQLQVALAGPAVNLGLAAGLWLLARVPGLDGAVLPLTRLAWVNLSMAAFNLLPALPLDGGRVLQAMLATRLAPERATQLAARAGQVIAVGLAIVGFFWSPLLLVLALVIWLGASEERVSAVVKVVLRGLTVRDGMMTDFRTLAPTDTLGDAVSMMLSGFQQDFPVVADDRLVGLLTHADLLRGVAQYGRDRPVSQLMRVDRDIASPTEGLNDALLRLGRTDARALVVLEWGRIIGLLTPAHVSEVVALQAVGRAPPVAVAGR